MQRYETHAIDNPEIPFIFYNKFHCCATHLSCICNWHENVEIILILEGQGFVRNNEDIFPVREGDIAIINANRLHDIFSKDQMRYACLIVDRTFFLQNYTDSNGICFEPLIRDETLVSLFRTFEADFLSEEETPYRTQTLRGDALQILLRLLKYYSRPEVSQKDESKMHATIKKVVGQIQEESHQDLTLDKIAKAEGWNKSYLAREFHRYTGQTLVSFLNTVRCEAAKKLLRESDLSIGEVGRQCGFNDQTYFTRKFRSHTGKTPGEYRKFHSKK